MIKKSLALLGFSSLLIANTTMCYKQNWTNPATIETTKLNGGKCLNKKSLTDMKKDGWEVKDIKINLSKNNSAMDYLYILSKNTSLNTSNKITKESYAELKKQDKEIIKKENTISQLKNGTKLYINNCQECHGVKAQIEAYNSARALKTLSLKEFELSLWEYDMDEKDNGFAMLMKPVVGSLTTQEIKDIYKYIKTLK